MSEVRGRIKILEDLDAKLKDISIANGYLTDFVRVESWDDTPTEYKENIIIYQDPFEKYEKKNNYTATLRVEIVAVVIEEANRTAAYLGNLAIVDLINAVAKVCCCNSIVTLVKTDKFIETKGVTACQIELSIDIKYQF